MKRILLIMIQPPGSSGVQGLIYNKILPYLEGNGWEFHFAGPLPELTSVLTEKLDYPPERLHYTHKVSPSLRFSIRKNRQIKGSLFYVWFAVCQLIARLLEKLLHHDSHAYLRNGLIETVIAAEKEWNFDLIAGKSPDFRVLETAASITRQLRKPFVAMVNDPHGHRDASGFYPAEPEKQRALLDQCCGAAFMSPLTRDRYIQAGLVTSEKAYDFTDSYPELPELYHRGRSGLRTSEQRQVRTDFHPLRMLYLGMLPPWRPIEPLLTALETFQVQQGSSAPGISLSIFGYLYPEALDRIQTSEILASTVLVSKAVKYELSHWLAEDADLQLVVIGPRHVDNQPSKFFEYLGHRKPILAIGPRGNPIEAIVNDLQIGVYADVEDHHAILAGLHELVGRYKYFQSSFEREHNALEHYSARRVAEHWCRCLDSMKSDAPAR
jgi:hypothetical protein